ncbi:MAG: hypothetical protein AAB974_04020 [Patescibacteria group bacterium]
MGLKDLIIDVDKQSEELIEEIVRGFVGYDVANGTVHLFNTGSLGVRGKILLFLSALRGWSFVDKAKAFETDATPSTIEGQTRLPGGSVRSALHALVGEGLLVKNGSRYGVPPAALAQIKAEIRRADPMKLVDEGHAAVRAEGKRAAVSPTQNAARKDTRKEAVRASSKRSPGASVAVQLSRLLDQGWFNNGKSIAEFRQKISDDYAINVPQTSLPRYFIDAVRAARMCRERADRGGSSVWVYKPCPK